MKRLAENGDGNYAYVDNLSQARSIFVENLTGTLQVIAKDSKVQVDFNPEVVSRYRLIGYENRRVADQDFRNDAVDAGEVGSGQSATALYEIELTDEGRNGGDLGTVYVRYYDLGTGRVDETAPRRGRRISRRHTADGAAALFRAGAVAPCRGALPGRRARGRRRTPTAAACAHRSSSTGRRGSRRPAFAISSAT